MSDDYLRERRETYRQRKIKEFEGLDRDVELLRQTFNGSASDGELLIAAALASFGDVFDARMTDLYETPCNGSAAPSTTSQPTRSRPARTPRRGVPGTPQRP